MPIDTRGYLHGPYAIINESTTRKAATGQSAIVYVGTAPVQNVAGGAQTVNRPIVVKTMAEARKIFGYSDEWDKYTLCEAMYVHLGLNGVAPLVLINVLDPVKHKGEGGTAQKTPEGGEIVLTEAQDIVLDTIKVGEKTLGTDYTVTYDDAKRTITIAETSSGSLGAEELELTWDVVDATKVQDADVIGTSDGEGLNTGLQAIKNVYQETSYIPAHLLAPGFSSHPEVHAAMLAAAQKINGHWYAYVRSDLPISEKNGDKITLKKADQWKKANGYNKPGATAYFPLVEGTDGRIYHISTIAAANLQRLLIDQNGIPYRTPSNTDADIIQNLYFGEDAGYRVYDDEIVNEYLNKHGIASAAYVSGRWVIWGSTGAEYEYDPAQEVIYHETDRMMLYYVCNDFQERHFRDIDQPMTANDLKSIVAEEKARLDALVSGKAIIYGDVHLNATADDKSDIMHGDFSFAFDVTTTPLAKSMTAIVNRTDAGYETYFADLVS